MSQAPKHLPIRLTPPPVAGGSADPSTNVALAAALRAAKASGVPRSNIENALKKVRGPTFGKSSGKHADYRLAGTKTRALNC